MFRKRCWCTLLTRCWQVPHLRCLCGRLTVSTTSCWRPFPSLTSSTRTSRDLVGEAQYYYIIILFHECDFNRLQITEAILIQELMPTINNQNTGTQRTLKLLQPLDQTLHLWCTSPIYSTGHSCPARPQFIYLSCVSLATPIVTLCCYNFLPE